MNSKQHPIDQLESQYWTDERLQIHFFSAGDPAQPCLLFLHGFIGTGQDWRDIIKPLSGDYYCIAPDLPGHGKTLLDPNVQPPGWPVLAAIIVDFIKSLNLENTVMIGYSMGGRLAFYLAIYYPLLFQGLVLESTSPGLKTVRERQERIRHDESIARELDNTPIEVFLDKWYRQPIFNSLFTHHNYQQVFERRKTADPFQLAMSLRLMSTGKQPSLWHHLEKMNLPLLLLTGESDPKFSSLMSEINVLCPSSDLQIIKQAGHNTHFEKPLVFLQYISNFLKQIQEKSK